MSVPDNEVLHIGITGTRHGMTSEQERALVDILADLPTHFLHHGCCVGVDEQAHWLDFELGRSSIGHPPTDARRMMRVNRCDFLALRNPKPYLDRNRDIVDESSLMLVVPAEMTEQAKGGTWYTARYARSIQREHWIIWPNGSVLRCTSTPEAKP